MQHTLSEEYLVSDNDVYIARSGAANIKPSIVVTKVDIPPAICFGSPVPKTVMAWNVSIIPITVPSKPSKGATAARNLIQFTPQFRFPLTLTIFHHILFQNFNI